MNPQARSWLDIVVIVTVLILAIALVLYALGYRKTGLFSIAKH